MIDAFFNPDYSYHKNAQTPAIHHPNGVKTALKILTWMFENDISILFVDEGSTHIIEDIKTQLGSAVIKNIPFAHQTHHPAVIIQDSHNYLETLKAISKKDTLFLFHPSHTLILDFLEVVDEDIPPQKEDTYILSRFFNSAYEDWFLATLMHQLTDSQQAWILTHLTTPFVASLSVKTIIMSSSMRVMVMYVEDFVNVIKKLFSHHFMDELQGYSFGFIYHFMFKE